MKDENLFVVEIEKLNRGNRTERLLDDMLNRRIQSDRLSKSPFEATREIVELFLQVVRRRNNLRRNWYPNESMLCDLVVLDRIEKKGVIARVNIKLDKAISQINGGDSSKALETLQKIKKELNQGFSQGQADIARTVRKTPLKNEVREIVSRIEDCSFKDLVDGLKAKQGGGVIVNVYDDAVEHKFPEMPNRVPKHTSFSRLRDIFTETKRELKK
jgi:hypothetical protein